MSIFSSLKNALSGATNKLTGRKDLLEAEAAGKIWSRLPSQNITVPAHVRTFGQEAQFQRDLKNESLWPLPNVWLGVSVEDQPRADQRIPILLDTPAAVRWISAEPLLGPFDLRKISSPIFAANINALTGAYTWEGGPTKTETARLDWVVAGGESGPGARPMHPDWARSIRDQCAAAGVPFLFKQWGEWWEVDSDYRDENGDHRIIETDSSEAVELWDAKTDCLITKDGRRFTPETLPDDTPGRLMTHIGKKAAGRLLDGVEHNGFPEVRS